MHIPRLTPTGERVMELATQESAELGQRYLGVEHLFLGVAQVEAKKLAATFQESRAPLTEFVDILRARLRRMPANPTHDFVISPRCKTVFEMSRRLRGGGDVAAVGPAEMLSAMVREGRSVPMRLLRAYDVDLPTLEDALEPSQAPTQPPVDATTPLLDRYGRDLTARAHAGFLSPVIGRTYEMDLLAQVLIRRNKNNPVLVGDAGVGKTAIVEGLAQRLVSDDCPEPLKGRRLVEISLGGLVAGTKFRGEFEERVLALLKEIAEHPDVIVFLDELHTLVGAGAAGGDAMDASNIFKPALARGEVRCIGATTIQEFRRHIEKDPALERRFEKVMVEEPSRDEAREILSRLRPTFEEHHDVAIHADAVDAAIDLTVQHVFDRRLPDKALDAIDQACARRRLERYAHEEGDAVSIGAEDVAKTVSQWTGIPLERLSGEAAKDLLNIEEHLLQLVYGQDHAVRLVARTILTAKAGLGEPNRPLGVFLFTGPTGVGKTHLARSLDEVLFGEGNRLVRFDMSEYMEEHSVSKLIGAPPGYVGHENEGALISALRTHPHCVLLFDEVEKAHPKVFDLFLQIFDEGRLTGSQGRSADFTQAVVILTSNVNVMPPPEEEKVGFNREQPQAPKMFDPREQLRGLMRPELVNRMDAVVPFRPLDPVALRRIIDVYVGELRERLKDRGLDLELDDAVYATLLQMGNTNQYGARELKRVVDQTLRQPLAQAIVRFGEEIGAIKVSVGEKGFEFHAATEGKEEEGAEASSES